MMKLRVGEPGRDAVGRMTRSRRFQSFPPTPPGPGGGSHLKPVIGRWNKVANFIIRRYGLEIRGVVRKRLRNHEQPGTRLHQPQPRHALGRPAGNHFGTCSRAPPRRGTSKQNPHGDKFGQQFRQAAEIPVPGAPLKSEVLSENELVPSEALC